MPERVKKVLEKFIFDENEINKFNDHHNQHHEIPDSWSWIWLQIVEVEYDFRGRNYPGIVQRIAVLKISKTPQGNEYDVFHF